MSQKIGKYTLLRSLAKGGMGEVFLARAGQPGFERLFAVKRILTDHEGTENFAEMLRDEARISIRLQHPNIVQVFEFEQEEDGFFLVMEYINGLSLAALLRAGDEQEQSMSVPDALWITRALCRALDYAHRKTDVEGNPLHIVHRDISPHNVLIDETGSAKLIDFGIAKAAQNNIVTEAGSLKGKIPYMAPEQAAGHDIDARADLYAAGAVLYECLAYRRLFSARNAMATLADVIAGRFPDFESELTEVPDAVIKILQRSITLSPDDRFETAAEMEIAVARALADIDPAYTPRRLAEHLECVDAAHAKRQQQIADDLSGKTSKVPIQPDDAKTLIVQPMSKSGVSDIVDIVKSLEPSNTSAGDHSAAMRLPDPPPETSSATPFTTPDMTAETASAVHQGALAEAPFEEGFEPSTHIPSRRTWMVAMLTIVSTLGLLTMVTFAFSDDEMPNVNDVSAATQENRAPAGTKQKATSSIPAEPLDKASSRSKREVESAPSVLKKSAISTSASSPPGPRQAGVRHEKNPSKTSKSTDAKKRSQRATVKGPDRQAAQAPSVSHNAAKQVGCVAVDARPWAHVFIKGRQVGTTPITCLKLPVGRQTLTLKNPALGRQEQRRVTISSTKRATIFVDLRAP